MPLPIQAILTAENQPLTAVSQTQSVPAPTGGLNARDPLSNMPLTDAVVMENWFPGPSSVALRNGSTPWLTGLTGNVESLMCYSAAAGRQLFAVCNGAFYGATTSGAAGAALMSGFQSSRWENCMFGTPGGEFMYVCDAVDLPQMYDGTHWQTITGTTGAPISTITASGTTATVTTSSPHGLVTGQLVTISGAAPTAFNMASTAVTVLTATTFTYTMGSSPGVNATSAGSYVNVQPAISSITYLTTTATLTTAQPHGLVTGTEITVSGATPAAYNGTYYITVTSSTTFTYVMASNPGSNASAVGSFLPVFQIAGVCTASLRNPIGWKNRLWFVQDGSLNAWYLPTQGIAGQAYSWPLTSIFKKGGALQAIVTATIDSASDIDEYLGFLTTEGELALYSGTDPGQAGLFNLVGVFQIGRPTGRRCWFKKGADTVFLTSMGYQLMSKIIMSGEDDQSQFVSYKIQPLVNGDYLNYSANFGWQGILFPAGTKAIINVPEVTDGTSHQWVLNTITGAWCKFTGWGAICFEVMADQLFFGANGGVWQADTGSSDSGAYIFGKLKPAFNYFGSSWKKMFSMVRPIFYVNGQLTAGLALNTDFADIPPSNLPSFTGGNPGGQWNVSPWNTTSWGNAQQVQANWTSVAGSGAAATVYITVNSNKLSVALYSIDYVFQVGGAF